MCECYKIGGPWISFDPECPAHGYEAQRREAEREDETQELRRRIADLEAAIAALGGNPRTSGGEGGIRTHVTSKT
jgi:hypothetical protein